MEYCKLVIIPLPIDSNISLDMCPKSEDNFEDMYNVPYSSVVGSLIYAMVCTRSYIIQAMEVLGRFMSNCSREH